MMKTYSPNNDTNFPKIDRIIEDIIKSEDRVKELTINSSKILETNEAILKDLNHDINHNCNRINLLKEFIQSEETQTEKEIKKREDEKKNIDNLIKDLEDEIFKFEIFSKKIFQESSTISTKLELERIFSSDVSNEIRENKLELNKLTDKKTRILKNLDEYTNSVNEISETLIMLREEKETVEIEIVNLISHKESLEELIQFNNFSLFKNIPLNSSLETINTSINLTRVIEIHPHEISAITNFNKFSRILFENLANFIQTEIKSKKDSIFVGQAQNFSEISIDFTKFDKSHFDALIKKYLTTYKESKDLYNVDDFFILLTKKIYDFLIQSVEKNYMFVIKEINLERLRFYFKYFFKIHRYENVIASKINFVNREFKILKKEKIGKIDELEKRIASLKFSWDKLQSREAQLKEKISSYDNNTDNNKNKFPQVQEAEFKLKTLRSLDEKMNALIELKNQLNCDIFNLNSEHRKNIRDYEEKIKQFEMINEELNKKHSHILKENDNLKIQTNEETLKIRNSISEKYKQLKELIKFENEQGNYADFLDNIQKYLNEKNRMYNFPRNIFSDDEIKTSRISSNTRDIMNIKSANSHVGTSRNQTLTSIKNQSEIQSVNSYMNVNNPNTRLDFIKTLDYSKFRDKPSISPIKSINTHSNFSHKKFSDKPHNLYQNNSEYTDSIISIEESNSNNQIKQQNYSFAKLNYINIDNKNNENSSISNFKSNTRKHKSRSIDSKPRIITQKMIDEKTIKKHVEALKSKINNECFGMIGDIEKNKKLNPLAEGSYCLKKTLDFSQSHRANNDNFTITSDLNKTENNFLKNGFMKCFVYLDKLKNKIIFLYDKAPSGKNFFNSNRGSAFATNSTWNISYSDKTEEISLTDIEKTIVSKNMKKLIETQQAIRKMQHNLMKIDEFNTEQKFIGNTRNDSKTIFFTLIIQLTNGAKIEVILFSYEEYKAWLNGLAYVIKNYPKKLS